MSDLLDQLAVADLITRERWARDNRMFDEMAKFYHPDSVVETTWFTGSGAEFVERSRAAVREGLINFHVMSPSIVTLNGDRALAETPASLRNFWQVDGVDGSIEAFVKLMWRAVRTDHGWQIAGLRVIYVRDLLHACNPTRPPQFDQEKLNQYRACCRYQSYHLARLGLEPSQDMVGEDRPETVAALRRGEQVWLAGDRKVEA